MAHNDESVCADTTYNHNSDENCGNRQNSSEHQPNGAEHLYSPITPPCLCRSQILARSPGYFSHTRGEILIWFVFEFTPAQLHDVSSRDDPEQPLRTCAHDKESLVHFCSTSPSRPSRRFHPAGPRRGRGHSGCPDGVCYMALRHQSNREFLHAISTLLIVYQHRLPDRCDGDAWVPRKSR